MAPKKENPFRLDKKVYERISRGVFEFLRPINQASPDFAAQMQQETLAALMDVDSFLDAKVAVGHVLSKLNGQAAKFDGKALGSVHEAFKTFKKLSSEDRARVIKEIPLSLTVDLLMARGKSQGKQQ